MKNFLALVFLFISIVSNSQDKTISGKVWNYENNEPMSYVNIGIANKTVGTVSSHKGQFTLTLNDNVTSRDTVVFSFIGFKTEKYLISELNHKKRTVLLHPKNTKLDEVVINTKKIKFKPKKIGRTSKGLGLLHSNFYTYYEKNVDDRLSKERGMKFKMRRNCHITDLNFNISSNDFKSLKFRVNFYKIQNGLPTGLLIQKNIIFEIKDNYLGWFNVNLEPYEIYIKEDTEEIAVTIQWIESIKASKKSKYFSLSTASSPIHTAFFREKAMDSWEKSGQNLSFYMNAMCE